MRCLLCKSDEMKKSVNTYFARIGENYVIIENVPCMICSQCGEVVYSTVVLERIDCILNDIKVIASKVLIMDYEKAA